MTEAKRSEKKVIVGQVVSDKMDKTVVVRIERNFRHPLYEKIVKRSYKVMAHNEGNTARAGNMVELTEMRPLSKMKRWRVIRVLSSGDVL
jgi:small subunit ribosomal protein S17